MSRKDSGRAVSQSQRYYRGPSGYGCEMATYIAFDIRPLSNLMAHGGAKLPDIIVKRATLFGGAFFQNFCGKVWLRLRHACDLASC
jgi:hypothetical protein